MNDRGGKGKMSGRVAKQRAIARGDNLAPTQVNSIDNSSQNKKHLSQ